MAQASPRHRVRVLQVVISLHPGGTERLVLELARRSAPSVDTAVCCLDEVGAWGEALRAEGVEVTALGRRPGFHPALGRGIARLAAAYRADVIHCHQYSPFVYGCFSRLRYGRARLLFTEHGRLADAPPSSKRRTANAVLARLPDRVFTVSEDLRRHLVSEGFSPAQVEVIYNGIDPGEVPTPRERRQARAALDLAPEAFVIGTVARLDPVKDLSTLVAAMTRVSRDTPARGAGLPRDAPDTLLLVVGDGPERAALEQAAASAGCAEHVRFLGHRDDARSLLAACDVYANSSIFEGVSLTILEAMAAGLPVVATAVGGNPEIVSTETGVLVPARNPEALSAALRDLANDPHRRLAMGAAGRDAVERRFTLDRMVDDYVRVYRGDA